MLTYITVEVSSSLEVSGSGSQIRRVGTGNDPLEIAHLWFLQLVGLLNKFAFH